MRVIPVSAGLVNLIMSVWCDEIKGCSTHFEVISERFAGRNTTLAHANWTIHLSGTIHEEAVEVQTCALIAQQIQDIDNHLVSHSRSQVWQRPLPVDTHDGAHKHAIRVGMDPADIEVVGDGGGMR